MVSSFNCSIQDSSGHSIHFGVRFLISEFFGETFEIINFAKAIENWVWIEEFEVGFAKCVDTLLKVEKLGINHKIVNV
jgi:hypothetical protein